MDLEKIYEYYGIDVCSYMKYYDISYKDFITHKRSRMLDMIYRRISFDDERKYSGRYDCKEYHELVLSKFDEYTKEILLSDTGKELQSYLKSIEKSTITYAELYFILNKFEEKYKVEINKKDTFIKEFIEYKILPNYNIVVYDVLSLIRMDKYNFKIESLIRKYNLYDSNLELLSDPPDVNIEELVLKNDAEYQRKLYEEKIQWEIDHGYRKKIEPGVEYRPAKKTAPTLIEGWFVYIVLMLVVSIFHQRIMGWIFITICFLIWRKLEIDKFN